MREILFRGKRENSVWWVFGDLNTIYAPNTIFIRVKDGTNYSVDPQTVGQFTGLTDKNGVKIFEGDILYFGDKNYLVFWNDECLQWQMRIRKDGFLFPIYDGQDTGCPVECITLGWVAAEIPIIGTMSTEIVGNIYDNPELLGGDDDD